MGWVREGSCPPERCQGRCCEHLGVWFPSSDRDLLQMLAIRGLSVRPRNDLTLVDLPSRCQYLTRKGLCGLHPAMKPAANLPKRPAMCDDWPTEPAQLLNDDCGFSFSWQDDPLPIGG